MALSEEVLNKLITPNARALSSPNGDEYVIEKNIGNINDFDDSMFLAETYDTPMNASSTDYSSNNFNPERVKTTKMSHAILEDLKNNPIDTTALNAMMLESAGNGNMTANNEKLNRMLSGAKKIEQKLDNDTKISRRPESFGGGIDYALIKTIVNECLEQKFGEMMEKLTSEWTTLKGIGLADGKIKLIDNKGNVFQAKLEYKGNAKEKK